MSRTTTMRDQVEVLSVVLKVAKELEQQFEHGDRVHYLPADLLRGSVPSGRRLGADDQGWWISSSS
jgi:hypothetical protein